MLKWAQSTLSSVAGTAEPVYGPEAIQTVIQRADPEKPYNETTSEDLKWVIPSGTNVETQTWYLLSESGYYGMAQIIYSNVAGIKTTVQFNVKAYHPDRPTITWSSNPVQNYSVSEDRTAFYADNVATVLSADGGSYKIKSMVDPQALVNITITRLSPGFKIGPDGRSTYGTDPAKAWGEMKHIFWPRCSVEGNFVIKGESIDFKGRGAFIHALQNMKPHHAAARWNFANFQGPTTSALMMEFTTPPSYGLTKVNVGGIARDGELIAGTIANTATHVEVTDDPEAHWPEPTHVKYVWEGKNEKGEKVEAVLDKVWGNRMDRVDVMEEVPGFIKKIVAGAAGTRPYIYMFFKPATLEITVGDHTTEEEGMIFAEATFIS